MTPELYWIEGPWRGRLAITARPRGGDWLADELQALRGAGIDAITSLLECDEARVLDLENEGEAAAACGVRFLSFPIPDRGVPDSVSAAIAFAGVVEALLSHGRNIAIHCRQSVGRAGLLAATVLTLSGIEPGRAIEVVSLARGQQIPETSEQRDWLLRLPAAVTP